MFGYTTSLRSITQGRGSFELKYDRYETVPSNVSQEVQAAAAKERQEEKEE